MTPRQLKAQQQCHLSQIQNYQHQQLAQELQDIHNHTQQIYGETSPQHAQSLLNLGAWHTANGDYAAADPLLKQAVHIQRQHSNPTALAQALNLLGKNQLHAGNGSEAQQSQQEALNLAHEAEQIAHIHDDLGNSYYVQENLAQALHHYEQAAAQFERIHGMNHPQTAQAYTHAASIYRQQNHAPEALSILQHTVQTLEHTAAPHHPTTAHAHSELAATYDALQQYPEAAQHYRQTEQHLAQGVGTEHPFYAKYLSRHAYHNLQTNQLEQAIAQLHQALAIFLETYEGTHPIIANTVDNIIMLMLMAGNQRDD